MPDFFISYTAADRSWAEWIAWHLEDEGYECRLQAWDFRPGGNFVLEMHAAAQDCDRTLVVLSLDYLTSAFAAPEWAAAFVRDPTGAAHTLVAVRVRECKPGGLLAAIVPVDLVPCVGEDSCAAALRAGVKEGRAKPSARPAFPRNHLAGPRPRLPDMPPETCNLPHRNPHFAGRVDLLAEVERVLTAGGAAALTALHGLGGVGKSQTAVEYAWRHADRYDIAWVLRAEREETLLEDLAALARRLQDLPVDAPLEAQARLALDLLAKRSRWLLVYDNAESETAARDKHGHDVEGLARSMRSANRAIPMVIPPSQVARADFTAKTPRPPPAAAPRHGRFPPRLAVMAGLVPAIHAAPQKCIWKQCSGVTAWTLGTSPRVTPECGKVRGRMPRRTSRRLGVLASWRLSGPVSHHRRSSPRAAELAMRTP